MSRKSLFPRVTIHTENYYRNFLTKTGTFGYCFSIAITLLVIFIPFLTTYSTGCKYPFSPCADFFQKLLRLLAQNSSIIGAPQGALQ